MPNPSDRRTGTRVLSAAVTLLALFTGCQPAKVAEERGADAKPRGEPKADTRDALADRFRHFASLIGAGLEIRDDPSGRAAYRRGKVVVVNVPGTVGGQPFAPPADPTAPAAPPPVAEVRQYDFGLREELERSHPELLAKTAEEVGTVILVRSDLEYVDDYVFAGTERLNQPQFTQDKAYQHILTVQLVDAVWGDASGRKRLMREPPKQAAVGSRRAFTDFFNEDRKEVADLIAALPERPMPDGPLSRERVIQAGDLRIGYDGSEIRRLVGIDVKEAARNGLPVSDPEKLFAIPDLFLRTTPVPVSADEYLLITLWCRSSRKIDFAAPAPGEYAALEDDAARPLPLLDREQMLKKGLIVREGFAGRMSADPTRRGWLATLPFKAPTAESSHVLLSIDTRPFGGKTVERMQIPRKEFRRDTR